LSALLSEKQLLTVYKTFRCKTFCKNRST